MWGGVLCDKSENGCLGDKYDPSLPFKWGFHPNVSRVGNQNVVNLYNIIRKKTCNETEK